MANRRYLVLYAYPPELDGQSLQGHYLLQGLRENGVEAMPCDPENSLQKTWLYKTFKPDVVIGVGFWGDIPRMVLDPMKHGLQPVPWFNADGWIANYQDIFNSLPLMLTTSNWVKSTYIRDGVKPDNIEVMPIGYDPFVFKPKSSSDPEIKSLKEMIGLKSNEKMILTIGGDVTSKGAQEMFKALGKINGKFQNWKYVLKTWESFSARDHGKEENEILDEVGIDRKKIIYLGGKFTPAFMSNLLNACDIYAAPSRLEGFGMIQLEAQACGKPVISINVGGPKDTIVHNKTGFLADVQEEIKLEREWVYKHMGFKKKHQIEFPEPKTFAYRAHTDQLAEYTLQLLTNDSLREKMGQAAAEHAKMHFLYKDVAKKVIDTIEHRIGPLLDKRRQDGIIPMQSQLVYSKADIV